MITSLRTAVDNDGALDKEATTAAAAKQTPFICRFRANIDGIVLIVQAQDYINVSTRERPHWQHYEIPER
jgi:hypothetical protein